MIELFKKLSAWVEDDSYKPKAGDIIFYYWKDSGKGDATGNANHVGIVEKVVDNTITVIEGNYKQAVKRRTIKVNGRYIRGYGVPKYPQPAKVKVELPILRYGSSGEEVKTLQRLLLALGYKMTNGLKTYGVDGSYGKATEKAVEKFQEDNTLVSDIKGVCAGETWNAILK